MDQEQRMAFVRAHRTAVFGFNRKNDGPGMSVVYYVMDGNDILISTMEARGKAKTVRRNPKVSLCVLDEQWPLTYLHPYGHVVFQAGRGDVHTVMVDGNVVKYDHRLFGVDLNSVRQTVAKTVEYAKSKIGEQAWNQGMNPEKAEVELIDNPYTYSDRERDQAEQKHTSQEP